LRSALSGGLLIGLPVGLLVAPTQEPAWLGFVVTTRWLAFSGKLPWKIMGFLDDAHRLGLLRTAGVGLPIPTCRTARPSRKTRGDRSSGHTPWPWRTVAGAIAIYFSAGEI
jgi:hypothetical protein